MFDQPLKKFSIKFQGQTPATNDPTTGQATPASGPDHGIAEIALESHAPEKNGMEKQSTPTPQTQLSPLEETLFKHWGTANGVDESVHSDPNSHYDWRGMYKQSQGKVHPPGVLANSAEMFNKLQNNQPDPLRQLMELLHPVSSHTPQMTSPQSPSYEGSLFDKANTLRSGGDNSSADSMLRMIGQSR